MRTEQQIQDAIRKRLRGLGWSTRKTHGNRYMAGWPDLMCHHPDHGFRWLEVKRPKKGELTNAQHLEFPKWEADGIGIWIATDESQVPDLFFEPANWRRWYKSRPTIKEIFK
jgi:hypothetical protein